MDEAKMPVLLSTKPLKSEFSHLHKIAITSEQFTVGRNIGNSVIIPFISISRLHCTFHKSENDWFIKDSSSFGIHINNKKIQRGYAVNISDGDVITFDPTAEFVYKFSNPNESFDIPRKRIKIENSADNSILDNMKVKFEESQNFEMKHIEEKIQTAKHLQNTSMILKKQLQADMDRKTEQLKSDFAQQIENLKGEKNEVERQKALLLKQQDQQLAQVMKEMQGKITDLMEQIQKHNEAESELLKENNLLKEKLAKEREEFLSELSRENSSKQDLLERLEAKIQEQEETRKREKQELLEALRKETEELRLAQEKELKVVAEQKRLRELELEQELQNIKQKLQEKVEQTEQQKRETEQQLNQKMEQLQKLSEKEKIKVEQLQKERQEIQDQLLQAQKNAEASLTELRQRETELASIAAARIQQQADQSSEVITTLQEQLEKMRNALASVETEKNTLLSMYTDGVGEGTSKQSALNEVGEIMENELQCSICAELFVEALTLNCSHTFCKYCITTWKKKKKDCPICRAPITAENRSLVLDTFIEKMVQNLSEEMKVKRQDILKFRAELVSEMARQTAGPSRSSFSFDESEIDDDELFGEEEEDATDEFERERDDYYTYGRRYYDSDSDSGSYDSSDPDESGRAAAGVAPPASADVPAGASRLRGPASRGPRRKPSWETYRARYRSHRRVVDLTSSPVQPARTQPVATLANVVVDLTMLPTQVSQQAGPVTTDNQEVRGPAGAGVGASPALQAPTTAATGAASAAARTATGRPAAPSGSATLPARPQPAAYRATPAHGPAPRPAGDHLYARLPGFRVSNPQVYTLVNPPVDMIVGSIRVNTLRRDNRTLVINPRPQQSGGNQTNPRGGNLPPTEIADLPPVQLPTPSSGN